MQRDNKGKKAEVQELQGQLDEIKEEIDDLTDKFKKATEIIEVLEADNEHLKD